MCATEDREEQGFNSYGDFRYLYSYRVSNMEVTITLAYFVLERVGSKVIGDPSSEAWKTFSAMTAVENVQINTSKILEKNFIVLNPFWV